jgi:hypothetical protein
MNQLAHPPTQKPEKNAYLVAAISLNFKVKSS